MRAVFCYIEPALADPLNARVNDAKTPGSSIVLVRYSTTSTILVTADY